MAKKFVNLSALDWDDSALIKAYNKGMSLRAKEIEGETPKDKKEGSRKRNGWKVGDFCRAIYLADNLMYEAKIIDIHEAGGCVTYTVEYLGYNEEAEVDLLSASLGKKARKKQIKYAKKFIDGVIADYSSVNSNDAQDESSASSVVHQPSKREHHHKNQTFDRSADYATGESGLYASSYPVVRYPDTTCAMPPPAPPIPQCTEVTQNPALNAMLTSWYMAGYYTGIHQAQKNKCQTHCCCRSSHNHCH